MTQPGLSPGGVSGARAVLLVALALLWVVALIGTPGDVAVDVEVLVIDFSRSVHPESGRILDAVPLDSEVEASSRRILVGFASDARVLAASAPGDGASRMLGLASGALRDLPLAWREGSDLLAGVRLGLAAGDRSGGSRMTLRVLGDLRHRRTEIDAALRLARAAGAGLEFVFLDPVPRPPDLRLSLDGAVPPLRSGESAVVPLRLDAVATGRRAVTISAGGRTIAASVDPSAGSLGLRLSLTPPGDAREIEIRIADAGGPDADPANDRLTIPVASEGRRRVHVSGFLAAAVRDLIADPGIEVRTGDGLPGDPGSFDAVILADVPLASGGPDPVAIEGLMRAVDASGTGLLVFGGPHAFRGGGYAGSALDGFLPLSSRAPEGRDIRVLLDRSGSMDGDDRLGRAIEAALSLARGLGPEDRLQIIPFAAAPDPPVPASPAAPLEVLARSDLLWRLRPGGGTAILAALEAVRFDAGAPADRILAVLSDFRDERLDDAAAVARLRARWERERVSVAGLLLDGEETSRARVAALGARLSAVDRITPEVFLKAVEAEAWKRAEVEATWRDGAVSGQVAGVLRAWNPTTPGRDARVLLAGGGGEPLAAEARRGAGRVLALATDPTLEGWTRDVVQSLLQRVFGPPRGGFKLHDAGDVLRVTGPPDLSSVTQLDLVAGEMAFPLREECPGRWIVDGRPDDRLPWRIRDRTLNEVLSAVEPPATGDPEFRIPRARSPARNPASPHRGSEQRVRWPYEIMMAGILAVLAVLRPRGSRLRS